MRSFRQARLRRWRPSRHLSPFTLRSLVVALSAVAVALSLMQILGSPPRRSDASRTSAKSQTTDQPPDTASPFVGVDEPGNTVVPTTTSPPRAPTTTAQPRTTTTAPPGPAPGVIGVENGHLVLNGKPYRFTGVDAYELATDFGTNSGCGTMETDAQLNQLLSALPPNSLVRIWAFQGSMATNVHTHQLDWAPLDRVFDAAAAHGQRLVVALTDQGGTCDGNHWYGPDWYQGGFTQVYNDPTTTDGRGMTPLSYWSYLQAIVTRYRTSPALGMWEPVSEPEASTCSGNYEPQTCWGHNVCVNEPVAAAALRHFFDVVGGEIHALDPEHLVESGMMGGGQCGTASGDYQYVSASPGIDVLSYHDYFTGQAMGGDRWNGLAVRFAQAAALHKPIMGGEVGEDAGAVNGCLGLPTRTNDFRAKQQAQLAAGSSGLLVWDWLPAPSGPCTTDTYPGDPLMQMVDTLVAP